MKQKFASTIAGASIIISLLGLVSRSLGFLREMMFAAYFGLGPEFDLYLVGGVLPVTINFIILYIGQNYFVPGFQKINTSDPDAAQKYFSQTFLFFVLSGLFIALLLFFMSDMIMSLYLLTNSIDEKTTAIEVFRIFLITIPFSAGISILSALLQIKYEFKFPAISILVLNISILILVFLFTNKIGIYIIPIGYVIGTILQLVYLLIKTRTFFKPKIKDHLFNYSHIKSIAGSSLLVIVLIEAISQLYSISDRYFYGSVSAGGIASLSFAYTIFFLPISIFSISFATALFPRITQSINNQATNDIEKIYNESISVNIFLFMPLTFILFYFGDALIRIAFERGKFLEHSTLITYGVLMCYSFSLVFYSAYALLNKIFYSLHLVKILLSITIFGILLKIVLNFLLVTEYHQYGLALSTSISYSFFFIASYFTLNSKLKIVDKTFFIREFFLHLLNCCICLLVLDITSELIGASSLISDILSIIGFLAIYLMNLLFLKHRTVFILYQTLQRLKFNQSVA